MGVGRLGLGPTLRWLITAVLFAGVIGALVVYQRSGDPTPRPQLAAAPPRAAAPAAEAVITPLEARHREQLGNLRDRAQALLRRHAGSEAQGELRDLTRIQEVLDRSPAASLTRTDYVALGVLLGDVLAAQHAMRWVSLRDDLGSTPALVYVSDAHRFFPLTWLAKRASLSEPLRVAELYDHINSIVQQIDAAER